MPFFTIENKSSRSLARAGVLRTDHADIKTPFFMPIGTYGAVKTMNPDEIKEIPTDIILSNSYHLYLRPGLEILERAGGLHRFMGWDRAILTDSGGFQVFSLAKFRKISDEGVRFQSHIDGSSHLFTPERAVDIQRSIGSDIMMMFDLCPPGDGSYSEWEKAVDVTNNWADRGMERFHSTKELYGHRQSLFPIVQGGTDIELRKKSASHLGSLDADGYAIGGLAVGEPKEKMLEIIDIVDDLLPADKPRYLMGVGTPTDLIDAIRRGVDMFDCVIPTRNGRNGQIFTSQGTINIRNSKFKNDHSPIDHLSTCSLAREHSRSYLHHLFKIEEILGYRIATQTNLAYYIELMANARLHIQNDTFSEWADDFLSSLAQDSQ